MLLHVTCSLACFACAFGGSFLQKLPKIGVALGLGVGRRSSCAHDTARHKRRRLEARRLGRLLQLFLDALALAAPLVRALHRHGALAQHGAVERQCALQRFGVAKLDVRKAFAGSVSHVFGQRRDEKLQQLGVGDAFGQVGDKRGQRLVVVPRDGILARFSPVGARGHVSTHASAAASHH